MKPSWLRQAGVVLGCAVTCVVSSEEWADADVTRGSLHLKVAVLGSPAPLEGVEVKNSAININRMSAGAKRGDLLIRKSHRQRQLLGAFVVRPENLPTNAYLSNYFLARGQGRCQWIFSKFYMGPMNDVVRGSLAGIFNFDVGPRSYLRIVNFYRVRIRSLQYWQRVGDVVYRDRIQKGVSPQLPLRRRLDCVELAKRSQPEAVSAPPKGIGKCADEKCRDSSKRPVVILNKLADHQDGEIRYVVSGAIFLCGILCLIAYFATGRNK